ncbi:MAG: hypothetical protein EOL95_07915 [Bacteroidia bacterium]|nr:hypothetical protein [Bacteroidia bacterium]
MNKNNLYKINASLLVMLIFALVSSIIQEYLGGNDFDNISNSVFVISHLIVCLPMFAFIGLHLFINLGKLSKWLKTLKKGKTQNKWLFLLSFLTLLTGIITTIEYFSVGHTGIGGIHGKIGFLFIILMIYHTMKRLWWYKRK